MQTKLAKTRRLPDGTIQALSSDGHTVYTVTILGRGSCTCPAGRVNKTCYHVASARAKYSNTPAALAWRITNAANRYALA